jgi:hypothetical protein
MTAAGRCAEMQIFEKIQNISQDKNRNTSAARNWK